MLDKEKSLPIAQALFAALLFGINAPLAKIFLTRIPPMLMTAFLYLGAGIGVFLLNHIMLHKSAEAPLRKEDGVWTVLMILLDVVAPFLLMVGLTKTSAANASLLFNFEIVATSLIALLFFKEVIGKRMWLAIFFITAAGAFFSVEFSDGNAFRFSAGSCFVICACICWGLENNCTRNMSAKDPAQIVVVKGFGSGLTALAIAMVTEPIAGITISGIVGAMLLGFIAYGLSIFFYVKAQRFLGAARTSAYYAAAPFIGVLLSFLIFHDVPNIFFCMGTSLMLIGTWLAVKEKHCHRHRHEHLSHEHSHVHNEMHHGHVHDSKTMTEPHSHVHEHASLEHVHEHTPDIHHRHCH